MDHDVEVVGPAQESVRSPEIRIRARKMGARSPKIDMERNVEHVGLDGSLFDNKVGPSIMSISDIDTNAWEVTFIDESGGSWQLS